MNRTFARNVLAKSATKKVSLYYPSEGQARAERLSLYKARSAIAAKLAEGQLPLSQADIEASANGEAFAGAESEAWIENATACPDWPTEFAHMPWRLCISAQRQARNMVISDN